MSRDRIIHPRRTNRAKSLGVIEDAARDFAREVPGLVRTEEILEELAEWGMDWDLDDEEAALAVEAYRAEQGGA